MSKINMMDKKIAVLKLGKSTKKDNSHFFIPETTESLGQIKYINEKLASETNLSVGSKVYFGDKKQTLRMSGEDLEIMELENIIAISED